MNSWRVSRAGYYYFIRDFVADVHLIRLEKLRVIGFEQLPASLNSVK